MEGSLWCCVVTKIVELIYSDAERRGNGETTPIRTIQQWFEKDGTLVFEIDPCADIEKKEIG